MEGVKVIPQERFPERTVEQIEDIPVPQAFGSDCQACRQNDGRVASLLERLDEFGKRVDVSLVRRSEHEELIKEIETTLKDECAIDSADVTAKKNTVGAGLSRSWRAGGAR